MSDQYLDRRDADVAVSHHLGDVLSPGANGPGVPDSLDYYEDVDGEANLNLAGLNASDEPLHHTFLKTKLIEPQDVCRRADVVVTSSMLVVVDFALARVSVPLASEASASDLRNMTLISKGFWLSVIAYRRRYGMSTCNAIPGNRSPVSVGTKLSI